MTAEETREKVAAFLDEIREGVAKILQQPGKGFDFSNFVSEFDEEQNCGTVCCMVGWIPAIRPDLARWTGKSTVVNAIGRDHRFVFNPHDAGIPIHGDLWEALTMPNMQFVLLGKEDIPDESTFEEVSALWIEVAGEIRWGSLDEFLRFDE